MFLWKRCITLYFRRNFSRWERFNDSRDNTFVKIIFSSILKYKVDLRPKNVNILQSKILNNFFGFENFAEINCSGSVHFEYFIEPIFYFLCQNPLNVISILQKFIIVKICTKTPMVNMKIWNKVFGLGFRRFQC